VSTSAFEYLCKDTSNDQRRSVYSRLSGPETERVLVSLCHALRRNRSTSRALFIPLDSARQANVKSGLPIARPYKTTTIERAERSTHRRSRRHR